MEIREYIENIRRWVFFIVIVTISSILTVGLLSYFFLDGVYESSATIIVTSKKVESESENATYNDVPENTNLIKVYSTIIHSDTVMNQIIQELELKINIDDFRSKIKSEIIEDTGIIRIIVENNKAQLAQNIASSLIKALQNEADRINLAGSINVIDFAQLPLLPVRPKPMFNMFIAAVAGVMAGIMLAYVFECMDSSVRSLQVLQKISVLPILGTIPDFSKHKRKKRNINPKKDIIDPEDTYKILRTRVNSLCMCKSLKVILITSPAYSEGKTTIAANVAISMSKLGKKVLLVDCNFRKPKLHEVLELVNKKRLTIFFTTVEYLSFDIYSVPNSNLHVVVSEVKPANSSELLDSPNMIDFINQMKLDYDTIIIDSPPVLPAADASILSRLVDGTILVVSYRQSTYELLVQSKENLNNIGANILGIVVNKIPVEKQFSIDIER